MRGGGRIGWHRQCPRAGARGGRCICSEANTDRVLALGAHRVVDYARAPWGEQLADSDAFDTVFDCVGGLDTEAEALRVLQAGGHLLTLCGPERFPGDRRMSSVELARMLGYIAWRTLSSRFKGPRYTMASGTEPDWSVVQRTLIDHDIRPSIEKVYPYQQEDVAEAFRHLASHRNRGKLVIAVDPDEISLA
jgi:alcohol dehydrogenase